MSPKKYMINKIIVKNKFPERLRQIRKVYNMTQASLARLVGITSSAIYNYESGKREPKICDLILLATILNVSIDFLTGKVDECKSFLSNDINLINNLRKIILFKVYFFVFKHLLITFYVI